MAESIVGIAVGVAAVVGAQSAGTSGGNEIGEDARGLGAEVDVQGMIGIVIVTAIAVAIGDVVEIGIETETVIAIEVEIGPGRDLRARTMLLSNGHRTAQIIAEGPA